MFGNLFGKNKSLEQGQKQKATNNVHPSVSMCDNNNSTQQKKMKVILFEAIFSSLPIISFG